MVSKLLYYIAEKCILYNFIGIILVAYHCLSFSVVSTSFLLFLADFGHFLHLYVEQNLALTQRVNTHEYIIFRLDKSYSFPIWDIFYDDHTEREN